jgi:hypothetical protein
MAQSRQQMIEACPKCRRDQRERRPALSRESSHQPLADATTDVRRGGCQQQGGGSGLGRRDIVLVATATKLTGKGLPQLLRCRRPI